MELASGSRSESRDARWYEVRLHGHLDTRWAAWFEGMALTHAPDGTTTLAGVVADQAALYGLLQKLRDLGLPLLAVFEVASPHTGEPRTARERRTP